MRDTITAVSTNWSVVFETKNGSVFQSDKENCWYINFAGETRKFDYRCLLQLKKAIYKINIHQLLLAQSKTADLEIISVCACAHCYVLTYLEMIALKELLQGTFVMLELNHIIYDRLYRIVA
ncbi:MAG: hypothetical protein EOP42_14300 [Sphingobacteriaceae bacterium]|nr:MAG: hypothetical protein EOP42_14300 [Sphingobacteriaceae bacterium]